jgi:hypothetical protein
VWAREQDGRIAFDNERAAESDKKSAVLRHGTSFGLAPTGVD